MLAYKEQNNFINICFILCTIFILEPHNPIFRYFIIRESAYYDNNNKTKIGLPLKDTEVLIGLSELLKNSSIRQLAKDIVHPIYVNNHPPEDETYSQMFYQSFAEETILLKKYLSKFKYFYKRYFAMRNATLTPQLKDKELNYFAIHSLFLIVCI